LQNEEMRVVTHCEINAALDRLKTGVERYIWLQRRVELCDVSTDDLFQTRFDAFYKVRRNSSWRAEYFSLMESAKATGIDFPEALTEISRRTDRIEASFASKLVATLSPSTPVIDKFVLKNFGLKLPTSASSGRRSRTIDVYKALCRAYEDLLRTETGATILECFDRRFPASGITELKKVDLVLWQIRE
jgi:hypothetical protein